MQKIYIFNEIINFKKCFSKYYKEIIIHISIALYIDICIDKKNSILLYIDCVSLQIFPPVTLMKTH